MRFASFVRDGLPGYGLVDDGMIRPVDNAFAARFPDLKSAVAAGALDEAAATASGDLDPAGVRFDPVIPNPGKIIGVGMNYLAHTAELRREPPKAPSLFARFADSIVGHEQPIVRPSVSQQFDYEGELAVIIGRAGRHIGAADAFGHVAGYACFLDGSVRDYQYRTSQFTAGKNFFRSGSFGPCLVTADAVDDPGSLRIETRVSGEVMQRGNTAQLCFGIADLIEFLSAIFPLEPGDVIATGTPSGVGAARDPVRWLRPGDVVEVEIEGVGTLSNEVVDET
ncbi:MAG: fumarylacetoacetate hydrolase family protein [Gammaproteobacteria bacterium]